jgi:protocatechuate 3,4-dioxygenase beta subunit
MPDPSASDPPASDRPAAQSVPLPKGADSPPAPSGGRRATLAALALQPLVWRAAAPGLMQLPGASTWAATPLRPTPAQTEGPFYPVDLPDDTDFDLLRQGSRSYTAGRAGWLEGRVRDTRGAPLAGAVVEIWQCDADGHYRHPGDGNRADPAFQSFGRVTTDADGRYRFRTIHPVPYTGRTPHIHLKVKQGGRTLLTTQVYVEGDPGNARDFLWRQMSAEDREAVTVAFLGVADGWRAGFDVVVRR